MDTCTSCWSAWLAWVCAANTSIDSDASDIKPTRRSTVYLSDIATRVHQQYYQEKGTWPYSLHRDQVIGYDVELVMYVFLEVA